MQTQTYFTKELLRDGPTAKTIEYSEGPISTTSASHGPMMLNTQEHIDRPETLTNSTPRCVELCYHADILRRVI